MYFRRISVSVFLLFFLQVVFGQKASQREWTIFHKGVDDYLAGQYSSAEKNFNMVISKLPNSLLLTANYLMLAKTNYRQKKYQESLTYCDEFIEKFPVSNYLDDIYYLKANNYYRLQQFAEAVKNWLITANQKDNPVLRQRAIHHAEDLIRSRLDEHSLLEIKNSADAFTRQFLLYNLAEKYYEKGNAASAVIMLQELLTSMSPDFIYAEKGHRLFELLKNKINNRLRIATLLPLSGAHQDLGEQILRGARMAVEEYNRLPGIDVEIIPFDYETRLITAVKKMREISADPSITAIFGPLENDIATACAALAEYENIPLILPVSSETELTDLSSNIFQLSTPLDVISENLVERTYDSLQFKRVVTLSPIDDYFIEMTQAFIRRHLENGGEIVAEKWYYPGDKDFSKQFKQLKRIGLKLTFQDSLLSTDSTLTPLELDSLYQSHIEKEKAMLLETNTKIDSADIPVTSFDAIFMPVYKEDISLIAPQFAYSNIQTQILGNSDWYDPETLKKNRNYLNGLIFISDGYINEEDWDYRQFRNNFRLKYQLTPEKFDLIGFDCFNFLLNTISEKTAPTSRQEFTAILEKANPFNGIYRRFNLGPKRFNQSTILMKYWHGVIIPLN